jgi:transcriptional regulator with XRE-family HTH domain
MDFPLATVTQFTDHLRALRKARGMTQTDLGRLIGVSQSRIADIERDPGAVSLTQMHQILSALGGQMILRDSGGSWKFQADDFARATKTGSAHPTGANVLTSKAPAKPKAGRHVVNASSQLRGVSLPSGKAPARPKTDQTLVNTGSKVIRSTPGRSKKPRGSW